MRFSTIKFFLILVAIILAGCATTEKDKRMELLSITTDNYRNAIRWGLYETANNLREAGSNNDRSSLERLKKIKVTAYKSVHQDVSENGNEAKNIIEIKYYNVDYMVEKTIIDKQLWKYNSDKKTWHLQGGLPEFK
jgi:dsDNA-specific endonuclease/ATPase MutS2